MATALRYLLTLLLFASLAQLCAGGGLGSIFEWGVNNLAEPFFWCDRKQAEMERAMEDGIAWKKADEAYKNLFVDKMELTEEEVHDYLEKLQPWSLAPEFRSFDVFELNEFYEPHESECTSKRIKHRNELIDATKGAYDSLHNYLTKTLERQLELCNKLLGDFEQALHTSGSVDEVDKVDEVAGKESADEWARWNEALVAVFKSNGVASRYKCGDSSDNVAAVNQAIMLAEGLVNSCELFASAEGASLRSGLDERALGGRQKVCERVNEIDFSVAISRIMRDNCPDCNQDFWLRSYQIERQGRIASTPSTAR